MRKAVLRILSYILLAALGCLVGACCQIGSPPVEQEDASLVAADVQFVHVNGDRPFFDEEDYGSDTAYISLSELDGLGRTGTFMALLDRSLMPDGEEREGLDTRPSGWVQARYDIVDGGWLWNRCHLGGWQLTSLGDEPRNLITGTRAFNVDGMLPFENITADHIREHDDHQVLYRVSPYYEGRNLVATGVLMESDCEDCDGEADYCVFVFNVQPGIAIDYATGESRLAGPQDVTPLLEE